MEWLWLEDQQSTVEGTKKTLGDLGVRIIDVFSNIARFTTFLVEIKKKDPNRLGRFGLILDVMMMGTPLVASPREWHEGDKELLFRTEGNGTDAGLVFYERVILQMRGPDSEDVTVNWTWSPPPLVLFLTVTEKPLYRQRYDVIERKLRDAHGVPRIFHLCKRDMNKDSLRIAFDRLEKKIP